MFALSACSLFSVVLLQARLAQFWVFFKLSNHPFAVQFWYYLVWYLLLDFLEFWAQDRGLVFFGILMGINSMCFWQLRIYKSPDILTNDYIINWLSQARNILIERMWLKINNRKTKTSSKSFTHIFKQFCLVIFYFFI